jgi:hypothetical protein
VGKRGGCREKVMVGKGLTDRVPLYTHAVSGVARGDKAARNVDLRHLTTLERMF